MPQFTINTNVPRANIPGGFISELSSLVAKLAGKPEGYVAVQVCPDQIMSFGGSTEACAICSFANIGRINNREFSKQAMAKITQDLKIPGNRIYIFFSSSDGANVGHGGSTFG